MARIKLNTPESLVFSDNDSSVQAKAPSELSAHVGNWDTPTGPRDGVIFDVTGDAMPLLMACDVRKLIKWLSAAADNLEGKRADKRQKKRRRYEEDDEEDLSSWN